MPQLFSPKSSVVAYPAQKAPVPTSTQQPSSAHSSADRGLRKVLGNVYNPRGPPPSNASRIWNREALARSNVMQPKGMERNMAKPISAPESLASQFQQMRVNTAQKNDTVFNPSMAPVPSDVSVDWLLRNHSKRSTAASSRRGPVNNGITKLSSLTRRHFARGDIISAPFHTANTNPHVDPNNYPHWTARFVGPSYNKRRMLDVLYIFHDDMVCLPLFTWNGRGIMSRPKETRREYVATVNYEDETSKSEGFYPPVVVRCNKKPIHAATAVVLTAPGTVGCNEDISAVGKLEKESYVRLEALYRGTIAESQKENSEASAGRALL